MQASPPASWYMHWHWHLTYLPSISDIKIGSSGYLISMQSFFDCHSTYHITRQNAKKKCKLNLKFMFQRIATLTFLQDTKCQIKNINQLEV